MDPAPPLARTLPVPRERADLLIAAGDAGVLGAWPLNLQTRGGKILTVKSKH